MMASNRRTSLRDLRLASAANTLSAPGTASSRSFAASSSSSSSVLAPSSGKRTANKFGSGTATYQAAPRRTLQLATVKSRDWVSKADSIIKKANEGGRYKETRRQRKKRLWLARQESIRNGNLEGRRRRKGDDNDNKWAFLPDLVLEVIFQMLPYESRAPAAQTCHAWFRVLRFRSVWSSFTVHDLSMTQQRFNFAGKFYETRLNAGLTCRWWSRMLGLRSTWPSLDLRDDTFRNTGLCRFRFNLHAKEDEEVLDSVKASNVLNRIAFKLRHISFKPNRNLHNICQFQRIITKFCEYRGSLPDIECFSYTFPCDFARKNNEIDIYGTGGMILQDMKDLLLFLPGLKRLELIDLELDGHDAAHILDEVSEVCSLRLQHLNLVNTSRRPFSLLAVSSFVNLRCLVISPHNLGDDLVECLGDMPKLRNLQIKTNSYTECVPAPVDYRVWKQCRRSNPRLRVHLVTEGKHSKEHTFQSRAPVKSVVYDTPYTRASAFAINLAVELYKTDLETYAHRRLPRFHMPKTFHERSDSAYLYLARQCPYIHTLMIRERISSSTVLLLAYTAKNLRYFHVRRNAIILRCDWPRNPEWSRGFYKWLRRSSRTYEDMEREVSQILGFRWYALNDKQFKLTPLNLNIPYYYEGFEEV